LPSFYSKENDKSGSSFLFHRLIYSLRKHLANQLIAFAALRLHRFAGRLPGDFTFTLSAFPPFIDYLHIKERKLNAWCLFFDFHRHQEHIRKRKLLQ